MKSNSPKKSRLPPQKANDKEAHQWLERFSDSLISTRAEEPYAAQPSLRVVISGLLNLPSTLYLPLPSKTYSQLNFSPPTLVLSTSPSFANLTTRRVCIPPYFVVDLPPYWSTLVPLAIQPD